MRSAVIGMKVGFQFRHLDEDSTYITRENWPKVEELIDRLIVKSRWDTKWSTRLSVPMACSTFHGQLGAMELPGWPELPDYPCRRFTRAVLSAVLLQPTTGARLGITGFTQRDEAVLPGARLPGCRENAQ